MSKSKLVKIYVDKKTGSFFIRATEYKNGRFVLRSHDFGAAISGKVCDADLGRAIRSVLKNCI